ncbi:MAG TPA: hypothetical protein PKY25_01930 [Bacilli bacterium]|nr:hypothetical protein [Bacilli bacterium]
MSNESYKNKLSTSASSKQEMEQELMFLNMLGYKMKPLYETRWNILDENDNIVGYIQIKRLRKKNVETGEPAVYGYVTEIDSESISLKDRREFDDKSEHFYCEFNIKREGELDRAEISFGKYPRITIWSKQYGFMNFYIDSNTLYANYKSQTETFNVEELVIFKYTKNNETDIYSKKEYIYQIRHCDKEHELNDNDSIGRNTREISVKYDLWGNKENEVKVERRTWKNGKLISNITNTCSGTVEEAIEKQKMGIDAISRFRYILNDILPFKQEIVSAITTKTPYIVEQGVELFFSDIIEQFKDNPCLDCKTKGTCDMLEITEQNCISLMRYKQLNGKPYIKVK